MSTYEFNTFVEDDKYVIFPFLDLLGKLGVKSARPRDALEALERSLYKPVSFTPNETDEIIDKLFAPWRSNEKA